MLPRTRRVPSFASKARIFSSRTSLCRCSSARTVRNELSTSIVAFVMSARATRTASSRTFCTNTRSAAAFLLTVLYLLFSSCSSSAPARALPWSVRISACADSLGGVNSHVILCRNVSMTRLA
ncbi:hypothetical protein DQ04_09541010 [Trypanosoma grayi]|uniref:hypothetical protein n=1 Tax=Trypanosoma grayi TaxID=71804 RepID=UPI0004F4620F|nr:hypothetical protein DQ04_09541010 [Trypanosoma grayi]KEG07524.1 hypothetical protein DQ04_09541010 [Trypanosoma grayi]